ncbi:hypothetical protein ABPG74_009568 [Tetrahymena malaccensis]
MNKYLLLALAGTILLGATAFLVAKKHSTVSDIKIDEDVYTQWKIFKKTFGKKFADPDQEHYRIEVFAENLETIKNDKTGTLGITQFADLSQEEFKSIYLTLQVESSEVETLDYEVAADDVSINWVTAGKVTGVKNQGQCGSCWAFSTTGSFESALILANKADNTLNLSEQQLVDCSILNNGCNGGLMDRAFTYIKNHKLGTEAEYPYEAKKGKCQKVTGTQYSLKSHTDVKKGDTQDLLKSLQKQPVSIAVDATNWSLYTGGVFSNCSTGLNHGVLLVGYENNNWIVKNSWGTTWGEQGYIRLASGNTCGLANAASYPNV